MSPIDLSDAWFLTGATAAGKTAVGLELAEGIGAEIISMDSMAVYCGMDIGTAKPTADERRRVPHHLIDLVDPHEDFTVARYLAAAQQAALKILGRGCKILFVGGTPLYLKALLRGIFEGPPADWSLRRELEELARLEGIESLHARLKTIDPAAAAKLHPNDARRLIRALEVHSLTGRPISQLQRQFDVGRAAGECRVFVLDWPRDVLYARIDQRVDAMFDTGLVAEVRALLAGGTELGRTAGQAVGYREVLQFLDGDRDLAATIELVKRRTRQFAKRQLTWFRSLSECRFVAAGEPFDAADVTRRIVEMDDDTYQSTKG